MLQSAELILTYMAQCSKDEFVANVQLQDSVIRRLLVIAEAARRISVFIVQDCDLPPLTRIGQVLRLLADAPYPVEAIVYTSEDLARCQDWPFIRQLLAEGITTSLNRALVSSSFQRLSLSSPGGEALEA
nr:HepT-like ribonuclease domain-containing protein [Thermoleptolyngbya sp. C42_A2020_037]